MPDAAKGRKQGRNPDQPDKEVWLAASEFSRLIGVTAKAVRMNCNEGKYPGARKARMNGGEGWQIPLECLPGAARARYFEQQVKPKAPKAKPDRVTRQDGVSLSEPRQDDSNNSTGNASTIDQAYRETLWERYEKATPKQKGKARRAFAIAHACQELERAGLSRGLILQELGKQFGKGASKATLWRIHQAIKGQDAGEWLPLLLPEWKGKTHCAPFTEAAWEYIKAVWGRQSQPSLRAVYRGRTKTREE